MVFKKMHPEYLLRPLNSLKPSFLTSFALPWFSLGCLAHMCVGTCEEPGRPVFLFSRREVVRFYVKSKWEIAGTAFCRVSQRRQSLSQLVYVFANFLLKGSVAINLRHNENYQKNDLGYFSVMIWFLKQV